MDEHDRIITIRTPAISFGPGALAELGFIAVGLGMRHAAVLTDPHLAKLAPVTAAMQALEKAGIATTLVADLEVEPTDRSFLAAAEAVRVAGVDGIVSVGGGSVIDTAKAANLYASAPAPFLTYVNRPIGESKRPDRPLLPHIACPTTCGTGSECTGIAVFDFLAMHCKTGIMHAAMLPDHAVVDPETTISLPPTVLASTALDALCHALEAYSCKPATDRARPPQPADRPMTQGANIWSDAVAETAIRTIAASIEPALAEQGSDRIDARARLMWAATLAGNAFGNAGCHVPHAMSYPVSGMVKTYRPADFPPGPPLVPHGLSVLLNAPAVYRLTGPAAPERHRHMATWLGADTADEPGEAIAGWMTAMMQSAGLPTGLAEIGYGADDLDRLVEGALPQRRLLDNAPLTIDAATMRRLFTQAMTNA